MFMPKSSLKRWVRMLTVLLDMLHMSLVSCCVFNLTF
jgi:hypothetical protein